MLREISDNPVNRERLNQNAYTCQLFHYDTPILTWKTPTSVLAAVHIDLKLHCSQRLKLPQQLVPKGWKRLTVVEDE